MTRTEATSLLRWSALGAIVALLALLYLLRGRLPIGEWYGLLSLPAVSLTDPIDVVATRLDIPLVSALLFGLIGALSPCQVSTGLAAFVYATRRVDRPGAALASGLAYVGGKVLVYTALGLAAVALGVGMQQASIPVIVAARKAIGPLLLVIGLSMLGVIQLPLSVGAQLSARLERQAEGRGVLGAFLLGVAFAFAFCPTLFVLFFGLTLPLAVASPLGPLFPALFALGTTLPLLAFVTLAAAGGVGMGQFIRGAKGAGVVLNRVAGVVFVLVGLHEIVLYWFI